MLRILLIIVICVLGLFLVSVCIASEVVVDKSNEGAATVNSSSEGAVTVNSSSESNNNVVKDAGGKITFFRLLRAGGVIGYIIIFLSFIAVAVVIEFLFTVRRNLIMPPELTDVVMRQLLQGQLGAAIQMCNENQSLLGRVLVAGMGNFEFGWEAVEGGAEDAIEEEAARLYRKIEYLNVIGNIAPMIGLLGTVVGMIIAFQHLAESGGAAKPTDLAEGIYLALVTTVQGLIVALPALGLHAILAGIIASLIAETTHKTEQILNPIKRSFLKRK
ncbi:MAG: MotA/TolQ/ExbB proton channel family protein [Planctomycetaceae bacterium]|jgi:biopolymer transport protein ExbB|nr:MotA/TolQ/ExbB proton channel family protein [Planctomycetaceae bacterium]